MSGSTLEDGRRRGWFWVEDALFDEHAEVIGVYGVAVYCLLARLADGKGASWPSYAYIARTLGIGRRTAMKTVEDLVARGLLTRHEQTESSPDGKVAHKTNLYVLKNVRKGGARHAPGGAPDAPGVVQEMHQGGAPDAPKGNTEKETHKKEVGYNVTQLDPVTRRCLHHLREIRNFPRDEAHIVKKLSEYRSKWPDVDAEEVCEDYREYCEEKRKAKPTLLQLRNFFKQAAKGFVTVGAESVDVRTGPLGRRSLD